MWPGVQTSAGTTSNIPAMQPRVRPSSTNADLARVLMGWLVVILFVQSMAAACAFVVGPQHHHRALANASASAHAHFHDVDEHHRHSPLDMSVVQTDRDLAVNSAALTLLTIVFGALALVQLRHALGDQKHVQSAVVLWAMATHRPTVERRPPRC